MLKCYLRIITAAVLPGGANRTAVWKINIKLLDRKAEML